MSPDSRFHAPLLRGNFFEETTHAAIDAFLARDITLEDGSVICAVRTDYIVHSEDHENITASARLSCYALRPDGTARSADPKTLQPEHRQAFAALAAAMTTDDLGVQSVAFGILPWRNTSVSDAFLGRFLTHIQARRFAIFGDEYPARQVADARLAGIDADADVRRFFLNLILPPVHSNHEALAETARRDEIDRMAREIYKVLLDGHASELPLAPINFAEIEQIQ